MKYEISDIEYVQHSPNHTRIEVTTTQGYVYACVVAGTIEEVKAEETPKMVRKQFTDTNLRKKYYLPFNQSTGTFL